MTTEHNRESVSPLKVHLGDLWEFLDALISRIDGARRIHDVTPAKAAFPEDLFNELFGLCQDCKLCFLRHAEMWGVEETLSRMFAASLESYQKLIEEVDVRKDAFGTIDISNTDDDSDDAMPRGTFDVKNELERFKLHTNDRIHDLDVLVSQHNNDRQFLIDSIEKEGHSRMAAS